MLRRFATLSLALPLAGCVAVAVGAVAVYGVVKYVGNEAQSDYDADLQTTWEAVVEVLQEQAYPVPKDAEPGPTEGEIKVHDLWVKVERHPGFTRVRVRVGTFETDDHKRRAGLILEDVKKRLAPKG